MNEETYAHIMLTVAQGFEIVATLVLIGGLVFSFIVCLKAWSRSHDGSLTYKVLRQSIGGSILLGLEILVAGDLIRTVAVAPTLDNVIVLGLIVLIRTFLSFSLEIEIDGTVPWKRAVTSGATVMSRAGKVASSAQPASATTEGT